MTSRPFTQYAPIARVGADVGAPYSALAGAVVAAALYDARWGDRQAREWLTRDRGWLWVTALGGQARLYAAMATWH